MSATRTDPAAAASANKKDLKRQRREQAHETRQRIEARERRRRQAIWAGASAAAILALGWLIYWLFGPEGGPPVQTIPIQGQIHIQRGQSHPPYNSKPPTSGWHHGDQVAPWGISKDPILDEIQVHNLEHGGIMIQYDCPDGCPEVVQQLETIGRSYASKVIVAPYPGIGHRIALTAWGKLTYLEAVDEPAIRRFVQRHKDKGPERVPD